MSAQRPPGSTVPADASKRASARPPARQDSNSLPPRPTLPGMTPQPMPSRYLLRKAHSQGEEARQRGEARAANPHRGVNVFLATEWQHGWESGAGPGALAAEVAAEAKRLGIGKPRRKARTDPEVEAARKQGVKAFKADKPFTANPWSAVELPAHAAYRDAWAEGWRSECATYNDVTHAGRTLDDEARRLGLDKPRRTPTKR